MKLPPNVNAVKDPRGRTRYRFRKVGLPSGYLPDIEHPLFWEEYRACLSGEGGRKRMPKRERRTRVQPLKGVSVVYFAGIAGGLIKIGTTVDLPGRLKKLQTGCPSTIKLLAVTPGGEALEQEYHNRFAEFRHRGEWFRGRPVREEANRLKKLEWCPTCYPRKMSNPKKREKTDVF
jgi:hypothetical protein